MTAPKRRPSEPILATLGCSWCQEQPWTSTRSSCTGVLALGDPSEVSAVGGAEQLRALKRLLSAGAAKASTSPVQAARRARIRPRRACPPLATVARSLYVLNPLVDKTGLCGERVHLGSATSARSGG